MTTIFKPIPGLSKYEISMNGEIRNIKTKKVLAGNGKTKVYDDEGSQIYIDTAEIKALVWKKRHKNGKPKVDAEANADAEVGERKTDTDDDTDDAKDVDVAPVAAAKPAEKAPAAKVAVGSDKVDAILALDTKKHIKIWKLHKAGLTDKEVADALGTNVGHVYNVRKDYNENPERVTKADAIE